MHGKNKAALRSSPAQTKLIPFWYKAWDGLDCWTGAAILVLAVVFGYLAVTLDTTATAGSGRLAGVPAAAETASPEYAARIKVAGQLLAADNMEKLNTLLDELIAKYPYQAAPFVLLADSHIRQQQPVAAMHAYRQALDLNLDYLERKSPLYQGKKIKNTVREAEAEITAALAKAPDDATMRENRKEIYYMLRKIAGGCSD